MHGDRASVLRQAQDERILGKSSPSIRVPSAMIAPGATELGATALAFAAPRA